VFHFGGPCLRMPSFKKLATDFTDYTICFPEICEIRGQF
jgi:hypothetical protein